MKKQYFSQKKWLIILFLSTLVNTNTYAQNKYALIVAIGKFADARIPFINSENDVPLIENALLKNGFKPENIMLLKNEKATKAAIVDALINKLNAKLVKGDIVVVHFSSHGIGIKDFSGDEADGIDETIVCYDTPYNSPENYKGEQHLIDDEIGILLTELRTKLGTSGQILVLADACFSGTISRGNDRFRTYTDEKNPTYKATKANSKTDGLKDIEQASNANLATAIVISASASYEPNSETIDMQGNAVGALSYAFSKAMSKSIANSTYKLLFERIKNEMAVSVPRQMPMAEGDLNALIFNDLTLSAQNGSREIYKAKTYLTDSTFVLNAGGLAEIMEGSLVELTPIGSNSSILATGKVISGNEFESTILLSKPLSQTQIMQAEIAIKSRSYAALKQKIFLSVKNSQKIEALLADEKMIEFVKSEAIFSADLLIEERKSPKNGNQFIFLYKNIEDTIFVNLPDTKPETVAEIIKNKVIAYAKSNYLRAISQLNSNLNVELKIVPIEYETVGDNIEITKKFDEKSILSESGQLVLKEGSVFILRAINKGTEKAFLSIIDIQPDNNMALLIPNETMLAQNVFLNPNDSIDFEELMFQVSPPYGTDMLKLIASSVPMNNLQTIFDNKPNRSMSDTKLTNSPFEVLMNTTMNTHSRSLNKVNVPANEINVCTKIIQVVK